MLRVTSAAIEYLRKRRLASGFGEQDGVRLARTDGQLRLSFRRGPLRGDRVVDQGTIPIFLDPSIADRADEAILDSRPEGDHTVLVLRRRTQAAGSGG